MLIGTRLLVAVLLTAGIRRISALAPQQLDDAATPTLISAPVTPGTVPPIAGGGVRPSLPQLPVLAYAEVSNEVEVEAIGMVEVEAYAA